MVLFTFHGIAWVGLAVVRFLQGVVLIRSRERGGQDC